jgi:hypothetical protein
VRNDSPVGRRLTGAWRRRLPFGRATLVVAATGVSVAAGFGAGVSATFAADSCPNAAIRLQQGAEDLPDCRAYEMVSPAGKLGGSVKFDREDTHALTGITADGNSVLFESYAAFSGAPGSVLAASYRARRGTEGWVTTPISPAFSTKAALLQGGGAVIGTSSDFSVPLLRGTASFDPLDDDPNPFAPFSVLTAVDLFAAPTGGPVEWLSRPNGNVPSTAYLDAVLGGESDDASHVVFTTAEPLVSPASGPAQQNGLNVYERVGGTTRLVGVDDAGALTSVCGADFGLIDTPFPSYGNQQGISRDGSRIVFVSPDPATAFSGNPDCFVAPQLYMRIDGHRTIEISTSQRAVPDQPEAAKFLAMTRDGTRVLFSSAARLTEDSSVGGGLYEYNATSGTLVQRASVTTLVNVSDDLNSIYITSSSSLAPGAPDGTLDDSLNLFRIDGNNASFVVNFPRGHGGVAASSMSANGERILLQSRAKLTAYDSADVFEVYGHRRGQVGLDCLSCPEDNAPPVGDSTLTSAGLMYATHNVSRDGDRAFFETPERLTSDDANGSVDVYEQRDNSLSLVSSGRPGAGDSYFAGISANGDDVLFSTSESLAASDRDSSVDLYDARVGGGPEPSAGDPPPCVGDACQGPLGRLPVFDAPGSVAFLGTGNAGETAVGKAKLSSVRGSVKGSSFYVKLKTGEPGTLTLSGSGLKSLSKKLKEKGTYTLRASLTSKAAAKLKRSKRLNVKVTVRFVNRDGVAASATATAKFKA